MTAGASLILLTKVILYLLLFVSELNPFMLGGIDVYLSSIFLAVFSLGFFKFALSLKKIQANHHLSSDSEP